MSDPAILRALLESYCTIQQTHYATSDLQYRIAKRLHELKEKMREELQEGSSYETSTHRVGKWNGKLRITRIV